MWQRTYVCGADPWSRPSVTPEYAGCRSDPCPSTHRSSPPRATPSSTSRSAAPARKSETTASTAIPHPAIAIPVWPVGTNSLAIPRRRASASSSSATVIFPIAQSEPTVRATCDGCVRFSPVGTLRPGGGLRRSRSATPWRRASSVSSGSTETNSCRPFSRSSPFPTQLLRSSRHAGGKRPPCVATPTSATVGAKQSASFTVPTTGLPAIVSPARVESRTATTCSGRCRRTPRAVLPKCGSPERPSASSRTLRSGDSEPGAGCGKLDTVGEFNTRPRVVGEKKVAVEVDVVHPTRDRGPRGDLEPGFDHAPEHHAESERSRGARHPQRLSDPARLRQLDVDPVRAVGARGDVGERVAVLVDVDRNGRTRLQRRALGIPGGQGLLGVLDRKLREELERLVERPVLVDVDLERDARRRAHRPHALQVEPVAASELQLQAAEPTPLGGLGALRHRVGVAEPHGPRRRRAGATQPEEPPHREPRELPLEVVQRAVDRRTRCVLTRRKAIADLVERPRVVPQLHVAQPCERRLRRLLVTRDRGRLSEAGDVAVPDLDLDDLRLVLRLARDHERLGEPKRRDPRLELHRREISDRRGTRLLIVVAAVAATAAPAGAGAAAKAPLSSYCGVMPSTFDSVALVTSGVGAAAGARGDVAREPGLTSPVEVPESVQGKGGRGFAATVDTYVHVVSDGAIGDVSNTAIQQQMVVVNRGFSGAEGGRVHRGPGGARTRSEERRVGKECRSRWSPYH